MPKVHFLNEIVTVEANAGQTIQEVAEANGINLHRGFWTWANCRGIGLCGSCKVWATPLAAGALGEKSFFERIRANVTGLVRLACKARIQGDCEVRTKPGGPRVQQTTEWEPDSAPSRWKERLRQAEAGGADDDEEGEGAKPKPAAAADGPAPAAAPAAAPAPAAPATPPKP